MEQQTGFKEMFLRLVAIVGLIAVLILGAWGIILLAFNLVGIFTGSVHIQDLFKSTPVEQVATTTPVVVTQNNGLPAQSGNTSNTNTGSKPVTTTTSQPTAVYTAAPRVSQLYGLSDLVVTMKSVTSLSSVQGRVVVQFTVTNVGTNVTNSGWTFNAQLPLQPTYTYQSQGQQALYPGDSIAYTLTYDDPRYQQNNQYCTLQYPNYNCNYNQNQNYYNQYNYQNTGTCYTYNGYQNIAGPCPYGYDSNNNPIYGSNYNYNQYYNQYTNPNYNYGYNYNQYSVVTITVDPQNWIPESVEYNNTASKGF